jgi:hypothetical protein
MPVDSIATLRQLRSAAVDDWDAILRSRLDEGLVGGLSDGAIPRGSTAITSKSRASAGISIGQAYQVWAQPGTSRSGGPSPPMTACMRSSRASTYRLVNVPVNPSTRFVGPGNGADPPAWEMSSCQTPCARPSGVN